MEENFARVETKYLLDVSQAAALEAGLLRQGFRHLDFGSPKVQSLYYDTEDHALIRASQALKLACDGFRLRPYIARYGGDEFIVVIESSKAESDLLLQRIREKLEELNAAANRPYDLRFSIGVAEYHPGMNANALIEAADNALYEIKRARPERKH